MAKLKQKLIGLTGNIGCGKSTVAKILSEQGVPVLDADQIARELSDSDPGVTAEIAKAFGKDFITPDGKLDRAKMRSLVFNDEKKRKTLESILHPAIQKEAKKRIKKLFKDGHRTIIYEASLLVEVGMTTSFDGLLVVTCPAEKQEQFLLKRNPELTEALTKKIIASQMQQDEKAKSATWIIENNGTVDELREKTLAWIKSLS